MKLQKHNKQEFFYLLIFLFIFGFNFNVKAQVLLHFVNLDFEQSQDGFVPFGWQFPKNFEKYGYKAVSTNEGPFEGKYCVLLENIHKKIEDVKVPNPDLLRASFFQEIDADYFRGKNVVFGTHYIAFNPDPLNYLILFVQQDNKETNFTSFDVSDTLRNTSWSEASIRVKVDSNAKIIRFGIFAFGLIKAKIDDCIFMNVSDLSLNNTLEKLSQKKINNLFDLAKVYGTVKYFYPSPIMKNFNWNGLLYGQIQQIFSDNENNYLEQLHSTFGKLIKVFPYKQDSIVNAANYVYTGVPTQQNNYMASEKIVDVFQTNRDKPATLISFTNISKDTINEINLKAKVFFIPYSYNGKASIWLRFDDAESNSLLQTTSQYITKKNTNWQDVQISAKIPKNTSTMRIGLVLEGDGEAYFDNILVFSRDKKGKTKQIKINNSNFEEPLLNNTISGWSFPYFSRNSGYDYVLSDFEAEGKYSIKIFSDTNDVIHFPQIGDKFKDTLSDGTVFETPINLPNYSNYTIERVPLFDNPEFSINYLDVYSRFAIIIELWNYIRHFSLNKVDDEILKENFILAIQKASKSNSLENFQDILNDLSAISGDNNAKVWYGGETNSFYPSIGIFISSDSLYITKSDDSTITLGSRIIAINNENIGDILKQNISQTNLNKKYKDYIQINKKLSGIKNSIVKLKIELPNGEKAEKKLIRNSLFLYTIKNNEFATEIKPGIVYLNSIMIRDEEFKKLMKELEDTLTKSIIIDLRGYSLLSEHIIGLFSDKHLQTYRDEVPVYTAPNHSLISKSIISSQLESNPKLINKKLVFLINEFTNSYSEVIAYLSKLNKVGILMGTATQGNPSEVAQILLPGYFFGSQSFLNVRILSNGEILNKPIEPDIEVKQTIYGIINDRDEQLEAAIEYLEKYK
jgi:C-terminal processing protease CtpA/Prc